MISPRHEEALRYAADGIPIFPCRVNGKEPACEHGHKDATTDENQINTWWQEADYNIGLCPEDAGWSVVDVDGPSGLENWNSLVGEHGDQRTASVRTPRGGRHFYFDGSLPASTGRLAEKIDTRGRGSYVLVPPSSVDGRSYEWVGEASTAPLPSWITDTLATSANAVTAPAVDELDLAPNIARAEARLRDLVSRGDVAVEGQGGDERTYKLATEMMELGLSPETTLDLMYNIWNSHCRPVWTRDELGVKIENASRYMQNAPGVFAVQSATEAFGSALDKLKAEAQSQTAQPSRFTPIHISEFNTRFDEPEWLIPDLIPLRGIVQMMGQRKSFKSFLALDLSLGLASNTETFGYKPGHDVPVVYCVGENANSFARRHVSSWLLSKQRDRNFPFYVIPRVPRAAAPDEANELIETILRLKLNPGLIVIDTATRALRGLETNSEKEMGVFSQTLDNMRDAIGCSVMAVRHTGKDAARGSRGSGALDDDADTNLLVERHEKTPAVRLTVVDQRNAEERPDPFYFEAQPVAGLSLVFHQITATDYVQYTGQKEALDKKAIGKALQQLGATPEHKVETPILATELLQASRFQTAEAQQVAVARISRALNSLARSALMGYAEQTPRGWVWFLTPP